MLLLLFLLNSYKEKLLLNFSVTCLVLILLESMDMILCNKIYHTL